MRAILFVVLSYFIFTTSCPAQLGAKLYQCEDKLGRTVKIQKSGARIFHFKGLTITAYFKDEVVEQLDIERTVDGKAAPIADETITSMLSLGGENWQLAEDKTPQLGNRSRVWWTKDGAAKAIYSDLLKEISL